MLANKVWMIAKVVRALLFLTVVSYLFTFLAPSSRLLGDQQSMGLINSVYAATAQPSLSVSQQQFVKKLLPAIVKDNQSILQQRQELQKLQKQTTALSNTDKKFIQKISQYYNIPLKQQSATQAWFKQALLQVNVVPVSLALAQAADESAWGQSRFAKQANNYFGQWCFTKGCGIVPKKRPAGATYEVAKFNSVADSVAHYLVNLNSNPTYQSLWKIRATLQLKGKNLNSVASAIAETQGLSHYSSRGLAYVKDLQNMIKLHFSQLPSVPA